MPVRTKINQIDAAKAAMATTKPKIPPNRRSSATADSTPSSKRRRMTAATMMPLAISRIDVMANLPQRTHCTYPFRFRRSQIAQPQIGVANSDAYHHQAECVFRVGEEAEFDAVALGDARDGKVSRGADQGAIAAKACAKRESPPQRLEMVGAEGGCHRLDERDHRRDEWNVVDDRRENSRAP